MIFPYLQSLSHPTPDTVPAQGTGHVGAERQLTSSLERDEPPYGNTGERSTENHLDVISPKSDSHPYAAHTDWLNYTFPVTNDPDFLSTFFHQFFEVAGDHFSPATELHAGLNGWFNSYKLAETGAGNGGAVTP